MKAACTTAILQVPSPVSLGRPKSRSFAGLQPQSRTRCCNFGLHFAAEDVYSTRRIKMATNCSIYGWKFCVKASIDSDQATADTRIRIGIMGCANIARKLSRAISLVSTEAVIYAVASRSIGNARRFVAANGLPADVKLYGSYEELLNDPNIEAVYVPLPTALHLHWAVLAAEKKKHILLEKPVTLTLAELDRILEACKSNGVQFMDGTMWMHHPRTRKIEEFLKDDLNFGRLKNIQVIFHFAASDAFLQDDIRVKPALDGLGALGDVGWYCIRASLLAADYELPKAVTALRGTVTNDAGVILSCGASLLWPNGVVGTFQCSFLSHLTMDITAIGTKGTLRVIDFVVPQVENIAAFSTTSNTSFRDMEIGWSPAPSVHSVATELPQEALMVKEFASLVRNVARNGSEPERKWANISRKTQAVLDAVKASIQRGYEPVEVVF